MMREPWFWREQTLAARAVTLCLSPFSALYDFGQQMRTRLTRPATAPIPIICVGNASVGGVGKTPFAIALCKLLQVEGVEPAFLTRGYGGTAGDIPVQVDPRQHDADEVGDEALLLTRAGPVYVARNRAEGASAAARDGASLAIMDDGYQNPTIRKTVSILLVDARDPCGGGALFPAGPMREPMARAKARANLIVYVGGDEESATRAAEENGSPYAAWLAPLNAPEARRVVAFCGIGDPEKFFTTLEAAGFEVAHRAAFPDHHRYTAQDLTALEKLAASKKAPLITTEKDFVRLPSAFAEKTLTLPVAMRINNPALLTAAILSAIERSTPKPASEAE